MWKICTPSRTSLKPNSLSGRTRPANSTNGTTPYITLQNYRGTDWLSRTRGAGEKPFESTARIKETSLPSSVRSNYSISDNTYVAQTEHKADFIAYVKALENRVIFLQTESDKADAITVSPPSEIIANTSTSKTAATLMGEIRKYHKTQAESMSQLTKMMIMFLEKSW